MESSKDIKKFYVPEIEEFHVGFEYEAKDLHHNLVDYIWIKEVSPFGECYFSIDELLKGNVRVKHLQRRLL